MCGTPRISDKIPIQPSPNSGWPRKRYLGQSESTKATPSWLQWGHLPPARTLKLQRMTLYTASNVVFVARAMPKAVIINRELAERHRTPGKYMELDNAPPATSLESGPWSTKT